MRAAPFFQLLATDYWLLATDYCLLATPLRREPGRLPGGHAAEEGGRVFDAFLPECERRTGAGVFGRSSAVEGERLVLRELGRARLDLIVRHQERALDVLGVVGH